MARARQILPAMAWAAAVACSTDRASAPVTVPVAPELRNAPAELSFAGATVRLETYLWRDFAPMSPPDGKPLIAALRVRDVNGTAIPDALHADSAWILNGELAWATGVREEQARTPGASFFEVIARDGPKWGPNVQVDVVVRLVDRAGHHALLRAPAQWINRTD